MAIPLMKVSSTKEYYHRFMWTQACIKVPINTGVILMHYWGAGFAVITTLDRRIAIALLPIP